MNREILRDQLGLDDSATDAEILAAARAAKSRAKRLASKLELLSRVAGCKVLMLAIAMRSARILCLAAGAVLLATCIPVQLGPPEESVAAIAHMTDSDLKNFAQHLLNAESPSAIALDACLLDVARRAEERDIGAWLLWVEQQLRCQSERPTARRRNLELMTVFCRLRREAGPLQVLVENIDPVRAVFPQLPVLQVRLRNGSDQPFVFTEGGEYRSGRLSRWRMEVRDAEGRALGVRKWSYIMGGGEHEAGVAARRDVGNARTRESRAIQAG